MVQLSYRRHRFPAEMIQHTIWLLSPLHPEVAVTLDRRPYHPGKLNYVPIMIVALAASLVLGRHLLTLMAQN